MAKARLRAAVSQSSKGAATESHIPPASGNAICFRQANHFPQANRKQDPFRFVAGLLDAGPALLFFHHTLQRMLVLPRKIHHLGYLGLGNLIGENPALPDAMVVHV